MPSYVPSQNMAQEPEWVNSTTSFCTTTPLTEEAPIPRLYNFFLEMEQRVQDSRSRVMYAADQISGTRLDKEPADPSPTEHHCLLDWCSRLRNSMLELEDQISRL